MAGPKRSLSLILIFLATFVAMARGEISTSVDADFRWWTEDSGHGKGFQLVFPLGLTASEGPFSFSFLTGHAYTFYDPERGDDVSVEGALDTKLNFTYEMVDKLPVDVLLGLDLNLPTGRTRLKEEQLLMLDPDLFGVVELGRGFDVNPSISVAKQWSKLAVGLGFGYLWRGEYDYSDYLRSYDPGDMGSVVGNLRYDLAPSWSLGAKAKYCWFERDEVRGQGYYREGDFLSVGGDLRYSSGPWDGSLSVQAIWRGKRELKGPTGLSREPYNGNPREVSVSLRGGYRLDDSSRLSGSVSYLWVDENDYPQSSELCRGRRDKVSLGLGFSQGLASGFDLRAELGGFALWEDRVGEDATYLGFFASLGFTRYLGAGSSGPKLPFVFWVRPGAMAADDAVVDLFTDFFIPIWGNERHLVFLNPCVRLDDHSSEEKNVGLGWRGLFFGEKAILGLNLYYDTLNSPQDHQYGQVGFGSEVLTEWVDGRFNYYLPVTARKHRVEDLDRYAFGSTSLLLYRGWEEVLEGFDAEVGVLLPIVSRYVETRVYLGGYKFRSEVADDLEGFKGRVELRPVRAMNLEFQLRRDDERGTDTFVGGYLEIPVSLNGGSILAGLKESFKFGQGVRSLRERMTERVVRDRHMVLMKRREKSPKKVADVIYVSADNPGGGSGTYEDPYSELSMVQSDSRYHEGTWIYIFSRGGKQHTYSDVKLSLLDGMVIWGQHYRFHNLGGDGPMPILEGTGSDPVLALASGNRIWGIELTDGTYGFKGENIRHLEIRDSHIHGNSEGGWLEGFSGNLYLEDVTFNENTGYGLYVEAFGSDTDINIHIDKSSFRKGVQGLAIFVHHDALLIAEIEESVFQENTYRGLFVRVGKFDGENSAATAYIDVRDCHFVNNSSYGLEIWNDANSVTSLYIENSLFTGNYRGIYAYPWSYNTEAPLSMEIISSSFYDNDYGIYILPDYSSTVNLMIKDSIAIDNSQSDLYFGYGFAEPYGPNTINATYENFTYGSCGGFNCPDGVCPCP